MQAVSGLLERLDLADRTMLTDPRHYNIRWLELLQELRPRIERFGSVRTAGTRSSPAPAGSSGRT